MYLRRFIGGLDSVELGKLFYRAEGQDIYGLTIDCVSKIDNRNLYTLREVEE